MLDSSTFGQTGHEIKIIGVGGGGSNAVNHMYNQRFGGLDFIVCNTDRQALMKSEVPVKITLGESLVKGNGAGSIPEVGRNAAIESINDIKSVIGPETKIVFVTAGMGGGTGTGAAPVIAQACKEMGVLTIGIVTFPFGVEGKKRQQQAEAGVRELRQVVDTLLVISNDKLMQIHGRLKMGDAFKVADDVLATASKSIADIMNKHLHINTDYADIRTVMQDSGVALMGAFRSRGEERAATAVQNALSSPLLNDNDITGAKHVLLNITYGSDDILMEEFDVITSFIQEAAGQTADLITGQGIDPELEADELLVTIIATGFTSREFFATDRVVHKVDKHNVTTTTTETNSTIKTTNVNMWNATDKPQETVSPTIPSYPSPGIPSYTPPPSAPQPVSNTIFTNAPVLGDTNDIQASIKKRLEQLRQMANGGVDNSLSNENVKELENKTAIERKIENNK